MENIYQFPDRNTIAEEAVAWLVRLDGDEPPTRAELEAFREWLSCSPVHREEIESLNTFWSNNILTELMVPLGKAPRRGISKSWRGRTLLAAAASLVVAVAITLSALLMPGPLGKTNDLYVTGVGQQNTVELVDGSTLQLNTNSQVRVDFNDEYRNVQLLQGEVYFQVAKMPDHPFRVYAGGNRVQAVGTAFSVFLNERDMNVTVAEGRVALATLRGPAGDAGNEREIGRGPRDDVKGQSEENRNNSEATNRPQPRSVPESDKEDIDPYVRGVTQNLAFLDAGQTVTLNIEYRIQMAESDISPTVRKIDTDVLKRKQSWREGLLVFAGEPLSQVIDEIGRYTTMKIELADPALGDIQIGGRFRVGDIEGMFAALETNFGIEITRVNYDRVLVSAAR